EGGEVPPRRGLEGSRQARARLSRTGFGGPCPVLRDGAFFVRFAGPEGDAHSSRSAMRMERPLTELADTIVAEVAQALAKRKLPLATYRIQFSPRFGLDDAARLVPYLSDLGTSHLYASPFCRASSDSPHGYDVVDHDQSDPRLGGAEGLETLVRSRRAH